MIQRELIAKTLPPDFVHVVTGTWATKAIHIDGALVTVAMLCERVREEEEAMTDASNDYRGAWGLDLYESAEAFDWGSRSDGAALLSLAWIFWFGGIDLHDWVFRREIEILPRATSPFGTRAAVWLEIDGRAEPSLQKIFSVAWKRWALSNATRDSERQMQSCQFSYTQYLSFTKALETR